MKTIDFVISMFLFVFVLPVTILVNKKLYQNIKNEERREKGKVLQYLMKQYAMLQCFAWPFILGFTVMFYLENTVFHVLGPLAYIYLVAAFRFSYNVIRDYLSFNSLILALVRYTFLIFENQADALGINRLKHLFISWSIIGPIFDTALLEITNPIEHVWYKLFMEGRVFQNTNSTSICQNGGTSIMIESPVYLAAKTYFPELLMFLMKQLDTIVIVMVHSNVIEGFIYAHIFTHFRRL